ncbi:MAG TPA: Rieske (2Fe-2S) protein [Candidatus Kryptonia bacterium]
MTDLKKVARLNDLREGKGIVRKLEDDDIALVKLEGEVHAFINVCPHQHTPLVDKTGGQIADGNLTCPMHGWTFELKSGKCVNVPSYGIPHSDETTMMSGKSGKLRMLEVKIENETVFVKMPGRNSLW